MEIQSNEFNSGMDKDLAISKMPANKYIEARNFRILTDKGASSSSLETIKGNILNNTIPDIGAVQQLLIIANDNTQTIEINSSGPVVFDTTNKTPKDLFDFISTDTSFLGEYGVQYNVYYNSNYILIVPILSNTVSISIVGLGLSLNSSYIPAQANLQVIGNTSINDDIYIITTNCTDVDPGGLDPASYGQIWKLVINDSDNTSVLSLIYNNILNLTTYYAIAPTAITGRYENGSTQRIYWTDFFNKIRTLNVANPQAFATDLSLLDLVPSIDFDVPILSQIEPGGVDTLKVGVIQSAYRLKNTSGAVTAFSTPSNLVSITSRDEGISILAGPNNFADYCGDVYNTSTTKEISWVINNVDTDYERIEFVVLIREQYNDVPTIYLIDDQPISGRESMTITVNGDILSSDLTTTISFNDFLTLSGNYTHCKTLTTKDNRLIIGNLRNQSGDLNFDARAYRFESTGSTFQIVNSGALSVPLTSSDYSLIDEDNDAINPSYLESSDPNYAGGYMYNTSGNLGGEGANISYEFVSIAFESDCGIGGTAATNLDVAAQQIRPFRHTANDVAPFSLELNLNNNSIDSNGADVLQEYSLALPQVTYEDIKYPQYNGLYWGYQQGETYRVGIQFYDKSKNPYFVKWIGDIKFPEIDDICPLANNIYQDGTQTGQTTYCKTFIATRVGKPYAAYITQLGLKVNVSIPASLTDFVSGYSIVRVQRTDSDKTVVAEGIITSVADAIGVAPNQQYYTPDPSGGNEFVYGYVLPEAGLCYFNTPNFLIPGITEPRNGDTLNVRRAFNYVNPGYSTQLGGSGDPYFIYKLYGERSTASQSFDINQVLNLGIGADGVANNGQPINNNDDQGVSVGNQCYFFGFTSGSLVNYTGTDFKLFATVNRVINNQYGGNTYTNRSANEYILCSHFRPVTTSATGYSDSPNIFGGDVINYHVDMQRNIKDWASGAATKVSTTFYFPSACCGNAGLRHGTFVNRELTVDSSTIGTSATETYDYNKVYSTENNIFKFFPKPDPYITNNEFPNRFAISEIKINGELNDSWSIFKPLNYWDVEGSYGPINACDVLHYNVYFVQDKAFGKLNVNPRTAVTSADGEIIQLGRGDIIDSHQYFSTEIGSKHQFSFLKSAYNIFFLDIRHKKLYAFNPSKGLDPLSDLKGMHSWLQLNVIKDLENTDKPVYSSNGQNGVHGVYDFVNNELILTFFEQETSEDELNKFTVVYSDYLNAFTAFYDHYPKIYITNNRKILSPDPLNFGTYKNIYLHNYGEYGKFYDVYFNSEIEFYSNKFPYFTKGFSNITWESQLQDGVTLEDLDSGPTPIRETLTGLEVSTNYQSGSVIFNLGTNLVRRFRTWYCEVPRSSSTAEYVSAGLASRMRDKFLKLKFYYTNNNNRRLILSKINTIFKVNKPS